MRLLRVAKDMENKQITESSKKSLKVVQIDAIFNHTIFWQSCQKKISLFLNLVNT